MNKILRYSFIALLAMVFGNVSAQEFVFDFTDETNPWGFPTEQYKETGTIIETRGRGTKAEFPNKGRPNIKPEKTLEEMTREELIERVRMLEDIKKSLACLDEQQKKNIK